MALLRFLPWLGMMLLILPGPLRAQKESSRVDSLVRLLSPKLRQMEARIEEIEQQTALLPDVRKQPWGSRYGHRSADLPTATTPDWLQLDLGETSRVDLMALAPVNLSYRRKDGAGWGFPKRFRIEIADNPEMKNSTVLVDRSKADVPNPGAYPLLFEFEPARGRYLRFTSLKHPTHDGEHFWALEEWFVLDGNFLHTADIKADRSTSTDLFPLWSPARIKDGQSTLGMPVDVNQPSPTMGYLSDRVRLTDPDTDANEKWCGVDLGRPETIKQVRLLPLESDRRELFSGRGFPRSFKLQLSNDPDFGEILWEAVRGPYQLGYPAGCSIKLNTPSIEARYVRILAQRMWSQDQWMRFGLAEFQVYNSQRNLALGKPVLVKDVTHWPEDQWAPEYLVDGYNSRYRLIEWPPYLRNLARRGELERERSRLQRQSAAKLMVGRRILGAIGITVLVLVISGWIWGMVRHRVLRKREAEQLRQQIARDLHDDIGSNLGGILLLSEIGSQHSSDEDSRGDFLSIHRAAEDASTSMRDIVWLIQRDKIGLRDFITRMRQSQHMILKHLDVSMSVRPEDIPDRKLGLLFRRHVFLAFKEVLNNVRKHANAGRVEIHVEIDSSRLRFTVRDEGVGFDPETAGHSGYGMGNLKRRASRISGTLTIDSAHGKGTTVIFEAPFSS
ncbi:MAG: discoidin domain-containing protein [Akkermansiaceae bacterium]|nr:discoidin domain-containing protein [Akkermansiaceae bacterium]